MVRTRVIMGMPITVDIADLHAAPSAIDDVFSYFEYIDEKFSTYKDASEISLINKGRVPENEYSADMRAVFSLSERTKQETHSYFDILRPDGTYDPSGLVKGWAIYNAAEALKAKGYAHFYIDAGGDIAAQGRNARGQHWKVGIRNPFAEEQIVKTVYMRDNGIATSGTYIRGQHIYNPHAPEAPILDAVSLTVLGPNVYEADRFATAAFAMGKIGIEFIERLEGFEGYLIDARGMATMTSGFEFHTNEPA